MRLYFLENIKGTTALAKAHQGRKLVKHVFDGKLSKKKEEEEQRWTR